MSRGEWVFQPCTPKDLGRIRYSEPTIKTRSDTVKTKQTKKNPPANAGDVGSITGLGRSPGKGKGNSFQYSCLENPMDGGAWGTTVHEVAKSWTQFRD